MRERFIFQHQADTRNHSFAWGFHSVLLIIWSIWLTGIIVWVDPEVLRDTGMPLEYIPFLIVLFLWATWLTGILRRRLSRGLWWGTLFTAYVSLRMYGLGEWWNGMLLLILGLVMELYWHLNTHEDSRES